MKRAHMLIGLAAVAAIGIAIVAVPAGARYRGPPIDRPDPRRDIGTGERLIVVVGGEFATREQAIAAEAAMGFHEIVGFLVARGGDFEPAIRARYVLVSAFRTVAGASQFEQVARAIGVRSVRRIVATYRGTTWIGLGQEQDPTGTGPLIGPIRPGS